VRAGDPTTSATVDVTNAGRPIVAPHAASSMSTTWPGQRPAVSRRNSSGDSLPVGLSLLGPAFSEPKLLALGYSFEQATKARRRPIHTPALPGEGIGVP